MVKNEFCEITLSSSLKPKINFQIELKFVVGVLESIK